MMRSREREMVKHRERKMMTSRERKVSRRGAASRRSRRGREGKKREYWDDGISSVDFLYDDDDEVPANEDIFHEVADGSSSDKEGADNAVPLDQEDDEITANIAGDEGGKGRHLEFQTQEFISYFPVGRGRMKHGEGRAVVPCMSSSPLAKTWGRPCCYSSFALRSLPVLIFFCFSNCSAVHVPPRSFIFLILFLLLDGPAWPRLPFARTGRHGMAWTVRLLCRRNRRPRSRSGRRWVKQRCR